MFAKPNEIGSAESLTTEIENVAGSLRLNVALPFEARRYEFSLPAGEEALDGSNEDEVPVLRRVSNTHTGEVIRTTSLPTVIKEVLVARYGGVISGNEWHSARATLVAGPSGSTDEEVRNAIEEFESNSDPVIMADGGIPIEREKYGYSFASCPNCGAEFKARSDERVRSFISDEHLPVCGEFEPIKVRWEGYARGRIGEYNADFENEDSDRFLCALLRQKTNIVLVSPEEANSFVRELSSYDSGQRTWMNAMQDKALDRVAGEVTDAMRERGFEVGNRDCFGSVTEFESGDAGEDDEEPEPETDGGDEVMTDGGSDEERHEREEQRRFDETFARMGAPDDARYIMVCHHCGTCIWRKQDSAVVKRARRNEQPCSCGGEFRLIEDAREEDYSEMECPNGCGLLRSEEDDLLECPSCSYQTTEDDPRADGGERLMADGGEEPTESDEESEEAPRWRDWSNVKNERNSERLMTDGGSRVHPDDEGVEILESGNDDDSDIIDAGDDGEIIADGGFGDVEEILETIEGFESERFRVRYRLEPRSDEQRFFASGPDDWRISSGVFILRNEDDSAHLSPSQVWDIREIPAVGECPECGSDMFPLEPSPRSNPKNSESGEYCCESCGFSMGPEDETVVIEYDALEVDEEALREDNRFKSATFNDHGEVRRIARQWVSGGDTFHRVEEVRCDECGRSHRSLASLLTWNCEPIPDEEFVRQHTKALTDEAAVERARKLYFEEDAVPPGAKKIDNQLWEFAAMPDPARELIEELESMSGDEGYSGWEVVRAGWADHGTGDGNLWVKVKPIEGMYIGGYPEKCGTYSVPQSVMNRINESRFYRVTSVKASTSGEDVGSFRIEAAEDDRLVKAAMNE